MVQLQPYPAEGRTVSAVAVEKDKLPRPIAEQVAAHAGEDHVQSVHPDGEGTGKGCVVVRSAKGGGGGDEDVQLLVNFPRDVVGNQHIGAQGHVGAVIFGAADGEEDGVLTFKVFLNLEPGAVFHSHRGCVFLSVFLNQHTWIIRRPP